MTLTPEQVAILQDILPKLIDLCRYHGLDAGAQLIVTPTARQAGDLHLILSGDGANTSTVTRLQ